MFNLKITGPETQLPALNEYSETVIQKHEQTNKKPTIFEMRNFPIETKTSPGQIEASFGQI